MLLALSLKSFYLTRDMKSNISTDNQLLVFGTTQIMRFDSTNGRVPRYYLGGNGIVSALAASKQADVALASVVGTDVSKDNLEEILSSAPFRRHGF
jgi:sugar/nucleoside kinase (ribokinase family)